MSWARRNLGGRFFWRTIMMESMHLASQAAIGQARLIVGGDRVLRADAPAVRPRIELWDWARCRAELPKMADDLFDEHGDRIPQEFLSDAVTPYTPSTRQLRRRLRQGHEHHHSMTAKTRKYRFYR